MQIQQSSTTHSAQKTAVANVRLWTALVTPFLPCGDIDLVSLKHLAQAQANAGNGIVLLGSTGEGLALALQEKQQVVQAVTELSLNVPILVAVGGHQLNEQLAWLDYCNQQAIDGYLLASPLYAKPGEQGQVQWFSQLLTKANKPCMLYNVPSRAGVMLSPNAIARLAEHPNCWALKEASGDLNQFLAYRKAAPSIALFSGEDALLPYLATAGAQGLVSVCSNAWPEQTARYVELCLQGLENQVFPVWQQAIASLFEVANPIPVKALLKLQQAIVDDNLKLPLTRDELASTAKIEQAQQAIEQWWQQQTTINEQVA